MKLGNARDGNDATSLTARLEQTRRRKKRLEKYRFVLRRPQRSWKSWTTEEVEKLIQNKMISRCSRREDQCRQAIMAFGGSAKGGINWKEFRNAIIKKLLVPVSVEQARALWDKYDKNGDGRISFHTLMTKLMPLDYEIPTDKATLEMTGTIFGYEVVDKNRAPKVYKVKHSWPADVLFKRMRQTLILRGGGLPIAMKYYSMQTGRNNSSGMYVTKDNFRIVVKQKFKLPASNEECDVLFDKFDQQGTGKIKFADMFMQLDIGKFRGSQKQQEMEKAARLKRRVKGPADWDPSASNERDLDRHPIPIYKRKFVNDDDIGSLLSTSSWGTASSTSYVSKISNNNNSSISNSSNYPNNGNNKNKNKMDNIQNNRKNNGSITARSSILSLSSRRSSRSKNSNIRSNRPKSASSTTRLRRRKMKKEIEVASIVSNTSYQKYKNKYKVIDGDDLDSELGDSASIVAERLSRSASESSSISYKKGNLSHSRKKGKLKKIPTREELLRKTEKEFNKKTIMAAIAAASHYRMIRELAHRKRPHSALPMRSSRSSTSIRMERPRERGLALYLNGK